MIGESLLAIRSPRHLALSGRPSGFIESSELISFLHFLGTFGEDVKKGMNVHGPLPEALGKVKFIIIAINYFTRSIEAKPLAKNTRRTSRSSLEIRLYADSDYRGS
ncbi:hypothetical protein Tco_0643471 [Tanacetum coccineum]